MTDFRAAEGHVKCEFVGRDGTTVPVYDGHNLTTFAASDAVALAYAGDSSGIPKCVAFLYGTKASFGIGTVNRSTKYSEIESGKSTGDYEISVTPFGYAATMASTDAETYDHNKVVFHCRTQNIPDNNRVYALCLLGKKADSYVLLAYVDLQSYKMKPADYELSLDWAVSFK